MINQFLSFFIRIVPRVFYVIHKAKSFVVRFTQCTWNGIFKHCARIWRDYCYNKPTSPRL